MTNPTTYLSPVPKQQFNQNGVPVAGGKLFTYAAGTTTKQTTYTDATGATPNTNPIILDANGQCDCWLVSGEVYKFVLSPPWDSDPPTAPYWTENDITGIGDAAQILINGQTLSYVFQNLVAVIVTSISNLRGISKTKYSAAYVTGYYASHDGGGGNYQYDPTDTVSADNGGTIIVASDGGRWKLDVTDLLSVTQFGAKLDGVTNNTGAMANFVAVTGATAATGLLGSGGTLTKNVFASQGQIADLSAPVGSITALTSQSLNAGPFGGDYLNPIINGAFDRWSLGTSFTIGAHLQQTADGWNFDFNGTVGTGVISRTQVSLPSYAANFQPRYGMRFNQSVAGSGNTFYDVSTQIEGIRTLAGQQVTISFWAISNSGTPPSITAVKTEQYCGSGGSPSSSQFNTSSPIQLTNSWARYSYTCTLASISGLTLGTNADDTLNVILTMPLNQTFDITVSDVQINPGPAANPFNFNDPAIVAVKSARRIQTSYDDGTAPGTVTSSGAVAFVAGAVNPVFTIPCTVPFRAEPAVTFYNPATGAAGSWNNQGTAVTAILNTNGMKNVTVELAGCTVGTIVTGHYVLEDGQI